MAKGKGKVSKAGQKRASAKISHLMGEGKPQKQAVAMALEMERHHRLGPGGAYKPVKKGKKK